MLCAACRKTVPSPRIPVVHHGICCNVSQQLLSEKLLLRNRACTVAAWQEYCEAEADPLRGSASALAGYLNAERGEDVLRIAAEAVGSRVEALTGAQLLCALPDPSTPVPTSLPLTPNAYAQSGDVALCDCHNVPLFTG